MSLNLNLTIFLATILLSAASSHSTNDPCTVTDYPALCRGTIKGETNPMSATDIAIKELMKRTRQAKYIAEKELKHDAGVSTCLSNFNSAFDNLDKALQNIKDNDGFSLNINLSAALTDYVTCSDAMKKGTKEINVVYKSAGVLYRMADNCLALSTLVKH